MIKNNETSKNIANLVNMVGMKGVKVTSAEATACISLQKILKTLQPNSIQSELQKSKLNEMNVTQQVVNENDLE